MNPLKEIFSYIAVFAFAISILAIPLLASKFLDMPKTEPTKQTYSHTILVGKVPVQVTYY
tara:strand:+ start:152692 stop:152871 length:180 start_codon:yes stop_codon:yes gene_type:complete